MIPHNYDEERIREFADEGDPRESSEPICPCGEEVVAYPETGLCGYCESDAIDAATMHLLRRQSLSVEVACALRVVDRAIQHIAQGRWHVTPCYSLVIQELTGAA